MPDLFDGLGETNAGETDLKDRIKEIQKNALVTKIQNARENRPEEKENKKEDNSAPETTPDINTHEPGDTKDVKPQGTLDSHALGELWETIGETPGIINEREEEKPSITRETDKEKPGSNREASEASVPKDT